MVRYVRDAVRYEMNIVKSLMSALPEPQRMFDMIQLAWYAHAEIPPSYYLNLLSLSPKRSPSVKLIP